MIGTFSNWLDQRTGYRKFVNLMLIEHIPGGAKWRYVWGSCLMFVFMIQLVTGVLLMTAYAPSDTSAWGSVYFIQYEMDFGWLIRGLHHYGSQTMVVLLAIHMLQVVIAGASPPREVNWWLGLMLMGVILGLSLTGYLLPWDQKGFFATQVATNIAQSLPGIGSWLQRFLVGGPEYGNATLTRFFTLHVWVLPFTAIVLAILHLVAFRRHGVTHPKKPQGTGWFYPDQAFRDLIVCLIIFGIMVSLVVFGGHGNKIDRPADAPEMSFYDFWAHAGQRGLGANLDAPADPSTEGYPARPEWYFLFLFQLLKYFKGDLVLVGTVAIPNGAMVLLFLLPLLGYGRMRKFGHWFGVFVVVGLIGGAAALTILAIGDDRPEPLLPFGIGGEKTDEKRKEAETFQHKLHDAEKDARRAVNLAAAGVPVEGARAMVRNDPLGRGPRRFEAYCAGCHSYTPADKTVWFSDPKGKYTAADLGDFGSAEWIRSLLKNPGDNRFFGRTKLTGMQEWRETIDDARKEWMEEDKESAAKKIAEQEAEFDAVAKFLSRHPMPKNVDDKGNEEKKDAEYEAGFAAFVKHCRSCHKFGDAGGKKGPNLTNYGSTEWIRRMVMTPQHVYLKYNEMPAFRDFSGPGGDIHSREYGELYNKDGAGLPPIQLDAVDRELIVRWLGGDHRAIFGGGPISGPVRKTKD